MIGVRSSEQKGGVAWLLLAMLLLPAAATAAGDALLWGPYVTGTDETSAVVSWKTAGPTAGGVVAYADETTFQEEGYTAEVTDDVTTSLHHVALTDLTPGTVYHYAVNTDGATGPDCRFRTFGEGACTFVVYSDTRGQAPYFTPMERHKLVADRIAMEESLSFVLHCGDFVTFGHDLDEWNQFFASGRQMLSNTTLYPALGNHEGNRSVYYETFEVPEWYSFDCGRAHVAVLDSNDWAKGRLDEETVWLEDDLAGAEEQWTFAAFHHPVFSSNERHRGGDRTLREAWTPLFERYGVAGVFSGHVHAYERYEVNGTEYFVVPCGGEALYPLAEEKMAGYANSLEHTLAYLRVHVTAENVTAELVPVATLSEDSKEVVALHPPDAVFETVVMTPQRGGGEPAQTPLSPFSACAAFGLATLWLRKIW
ncbi:putative phosphodiesterase [Methanofollis sp. W23]|uniref:metallophosphoesterase family protein n=1 Tax=Methanofollis sp. W23 TaxID=2817849 RepID=UPI001AE2865A|nr:metallophosphoesterase family protein [Methanofollis sp. W23]MBP2145734.1 putative phosphodiesterase [Methanofollis sp. W23]